MISALINNVSIFHLGLKGMPTMNHPTNLHQAPQRALIQARIRMTYRRFMKGVQSWYLIQARVAIPILNTYMLTVKPFETDTKLGKTAALSSHEQSTTLNISHPLHPHRRKIIKLDKD